MRSIKYAEGVFAFDIEPNTPGAETVTAEELTRSGWNPLLVQALAGFLPSNLSKAQAMSPPAPAAKPLRSDDDGRTA
ncbi:MAG TPA: hypothetical protein VJV75_04820 [Candidatus Polarisedimenticolia bacterium]|nr:hypothetical protein [Candidatus Polarisedimenticolia bacterium]